MLIPTLYEAQSNLCIFLNLKKLIRDITQAIDHIKICSFYSNIFDSEYLTEYKEQFFLFYTV
jgi:hypothetical protein